MRAGRAKRPAVASFPRSRIVMPDGEITDAAVRGLHGEKPLVALFFDCVATRMRMGDVFGFELQALGERLGGAPFVGCNTHGQIARAEGQFGGFHNCTAVVCVLPS